MCTSLYSENLEKGVISLFIHTCAHMHTRAHAHVCDMWHYHTPPHDVDVLSASRQHAINNFFTHFNLKYIELNS